MGRRRRPALVMVMLATMAAALVGGATAAAADASGDEPGLALASALFGGSSSISSNGESSGAVADAIWGALSSGRDDARARVLLASLLGLDPSAAKATGGSRTTAAGRALLGFSVEEGMAPLSRYSATMQGECDALVLAARARLFLPPAQ